MSKPKNIIYITNQKKVAKKFSGFLSNLDDYEIVKVEESNVSYLAHNIIKRKKQKTTREKVKNAVDNLGIRQNLLGYSLLIDVVAKKFNQENPDRQSLKTVYIEVAKQYELTPDTVERNIRYSIKSAIKCGNRKAFDNLLGGKSFSCKFDYPTNKMVIEAIALSLAN